MSFPVKRKGVGEATTTTGGGDVASRTRPTVKRRRTDETCYTAGQEPSSSGGVSNDLQADDIERTVEQDERPMSPIARVVKREDVRDTREEEPFPGFPSSGSTKMESPARFKSKGSGSSSIPDTADESSEQHWRRSAAPSPFATAHNAPQRRLIDLHDIPSVLPCVLTPSAGNPGRCPCGQYVFYAVCAHVAATEAFKCGARRASRSGAAVFCASPAPRHNVDDYMVSQPCPHCLDPTPVVRLSGP